VRATATCLVMPWVHTRPGPPLPPTRSLSPDHPAHTWPRFALYRTAIPPYARTVTSSRPTPARNPSPEGGTAAALIGAGSYTAAVRGAFPPAYSHKVVYCTGEGFGWLRTLSSASKSSPSCERVRARILAQNCCKGISCSSTEPISPAIAPAHPPLAQFCSSRSPLAGAIPRQAAAPTAATEVNVQVCCFDADAAAQPPRGQAAQCSRRG
jgi:hypothetical protein